VQRPLLEWTPFGCRAVVVLWLIANEFGQGKAKGGHAIFIVMMMVMMRVRHQLRRQLHQYRQGKHFVVHCGIAIVILITTFLITLIIAGAVPVVGERRLQSRLSELPFVPGTVRQEVQEQDLTARRLPLNRSAATQPVLLGQVNLNGPQAIFVKRNDGTKGNRKR